MLVITAGVKAQESFYQDVTTWSMGESKVQSPKSKVEASTSQPLFFPSWDILPHEPKLPHVDVISERLETLVNLSKVQDPKPKGKAKKTSASQLIVANVVALMQRTFAPGMIAARTRTLRRGETIDPLDLVEWLEDEGYEPEAQVNAKGELALRGGILDIFPPTCPWPLRLEFFGDELESIREFDPSTQLSKEPVESVTIPPAGELGILRRLLGAKSPTPPPLATLLDHLPDNTLVVICDPEAVAQGAADYAIQVPPSDPFFVSWEELQNAMTARGLVTTELGEFTEVLESDDESATAEQLQFQSLDAFRPIAERAVDLAIAEAQRREFFAQLHRWLRQGRAVHVFCNTLGEQQRF